MKVLDGEEVIVAKSGKPLVRIIPYVDKKDTITFGLLKGKIHMAEDFNEFHPEPEDMFKNYIPEEQYGLFIRYIDLYLAS